MLPVILVKLSFFKCATSMCTRKSCGNPCRRDVNCMKLLMFYIRGRQNQIYNTPPRNCYLINNTRIVTVAFKIFLQTYNIPPSLNTTSIVYKYQDIIKRTIVNFILVRLYYVYNYIYYINILLMKNIRYL